MNLATTLPSLEEIHAFLSAHYKRERFEGRNDLVWGRDYSRVVAQGHLDSLAKFGRGFVGQHESATGRPVRYDSSLRELGEAE